MTSNKAHNYNFARQKYLLLQKQHEELFDHLEQIRPCKASISSISTRPLRASSTLLIPPKRSSYIGELKHGSSRIRCNGWNAAAAASLDTTPDEETISEISAEEQRLFHVNESIKRILTEMLNCDAVRGNNSMRMWTQRRLMDTEKELRFGRRRNQLSMYGLNC